MKFFSFLQAFGFTRNEIKVVLLLAITFVAGLALRQFNSNQAANDSDRRFDYSVPDSIFIARSRNADSVRSRDREPASVADISAREPHRVAIININTATKSQLMQLPGIGEAYAERIIIHRDDHGPFKSIEELENVKGIGKKKLERLKPYVTVR